MKKGPVTVEGIRKKYSEMMNALVDGDIHPRKFERVSEEFHEYCLGYVLNLLKEIDQRDLIISDLEKKIK